MLWPKHAPRELGADVPQRIRDLYAEAARAEAAGAQRLAGAGYRATVEEICKDQGATKNSLFDKITELTAKLGQDIVDALHEARLVGNVSLHDGLVFFQEEIADLADLVAEVTFVLYDQPAQRKRMANARKQRQDAHKNGALQP
ncbi:MAG TPA: DUF4145 domain-containing protein [Yinghuangia sp.]|nr:DUF4145 domain-containing protein [Yinghuangia sp.]